MKRRRSSNKRRKGGRLLLKLIVLVGFLSVVGWVGVTKYLLWQKIELLPEMKGHDFIAQDVSAPVILVAKQSSTISELDSLQVLKADYEKRTVSIIDLPVNLSDGVTPVGQYLESHYYKELQIAVEGQLALPLTGFIIQPRTDASLAQSSIVDTLSLKKAPSWWSTTLGLPLWIESTATIYSNLSDWEILQLTWLIRDLGLDESVVTRVPSTATSTTEGLLQLTPSQIDPIIQQIFISDDVRRDATSIVVKNATLVDGLAALASRFVANMGAEVVAVEPADTSQTNSSVTAESENSITRSIKQFLGVPTTIQQRTGRERADVELIIGTDALARLGK